VSRRPPGAASDYLPAASTVEVICITFLINRLPPRELHIRMRRPAEVRDHSIGLAQATMAVLGVFADPLNSVVHYIVED